MFYGENTSIFMCNYSLYCITDFIGSELIFISIDYGITQLISDVRSVVEVLLEVVFVSGHISLSMSEKNMRTA